MQSILVGPQSNVLLDVAYPILLEALLRAEVTAFDTELQTRRALQGPRFIVAISPAALVLGIRVGHHRGDKIVYLESPRTK